MLGSMIAAWSPWPSPCSTRGSATALGQVLAARTVPMVVFLLLGGVIADRWPRSLVCRPPTSISAPWRRGQAALVITGHAELWLVLVLQMAAGVASGLSFPAMAGMVPQLVPRDQLQQANVLLSMSAAA